MRVQRTREEIEEQVNNFFPNGGWEARHHAMISVIYEVVLDIRDLLQREEKEE